MDDSDSAAGLRAAIEAAVTGWCIESGGGMLTEFIFLGEFITSTGEIAHLITQGDQSVARSLGLVAYQDEVYRTAARCEFYPVLYEADEDDE